MTDQQHCSNLTLPTLKAHAALWAEEHFAIERITLYKTSARHPISTGYRHEYIIVAWVSDGASTFEDYQNWAHESCLHIREDIPHFYRGGQRVNTSWIWLTLDPEDKDGANAILRRYVLEKTTIDLFDRNEAGQTLPPESMELFSAPELNLSFLVTIQQKKSI